MSLAGDALLFQGAQQRRQDQAVGHRPGDVADEDAGVLAAAGQLGQRRGADGCGAGRRRWRPRDRPAARRAGWPAGRRRGRRAGPRPVRCGRNRDVCAWWSDSGEGTKVAMVFVAGREGNVNGGVRPAVAAPSMRQLNQPERFRLVGFFAFPMPRRRTAAFEGGPQPPA